MPILDISASKPIQNAEGKRLFRPQRRTLSAETAPALLSGSSGRGGFAAAKMDRLTQDWIGRTGAADQDLFADNKRLRARARDLALNSPFAAKYLQMVQQNVVGAQGIIVQAKVRNQNGKETEATKAVNQRIEQAWNKWCAACTADGRLTFADLQRQAIMTWAREGENLAKAVYGRQYSCGFAVQPLDNDQLDDTIVRTVGTTEIRMGVEVDSLRKPVAYHLWSRHPYDTLPGAQALERVRIPAEFIVHTAVFERPGQTRGYTPMANAMKSMNQYDRYEEAVIVASRASAAKFGVIQQQLAEGWSPDDEDEEGNDRNTDGTAFMSGNTGEIPVLDPGQTFNFTDPRFPTTTHEEFTRTILRNMASGLRVSYASLSSDLSGVNFSSIRAGMLDERDCWMGLQQWFINHFCKPVFVMWLNMALLTELADITLTAEQKDQFEWRARGWDWVDPQKDANAVLLKLGDGLTTRTRELAKMGLDFETIMEEAAAEQKFIDSLKLKLGVDLTGDQSGKGVAAGEEATDLANGGKDKASSAAKSK